MKPILIAQYKRAERGKRRKIDEIIRVYIEEILLKFDKAMRSLDEARRLSYKEHRENAQAPRAEEGRDKLRKAMRKSKYLAIHRYPNEETHLRKRTQVSAYE